MRAAPSPGAPGSPKRLCAPRGARAVPSASAAVPGAGAAGGDALLALLKRWWPLRGPDGRRYHDWLVLAVACAARRLGASRGTLARVVDELLRWAVARGLDTRGKARRHLKAVGWAYSARGAARCWGERGLRRALRAVLRAELGREPGAEEVERAAAAVLRALAALRANA